jgi:hypothetical protein
MEYVRAIYERYRTSGRKVKKVILIEFCANTGYHRKYAIRLRNGPRPEQRLERRRRGPSYSQETTLRERVKGMGVIGDLRLRQVHNILERRGPIGEGICHDSTEFSEGTGGKQAVIPGVTGLRAVLSAWRRRKRHVSRF